MRVAVVGGGIFGCTSAIYIARAGHDVHLLEEKAALLQCASGLNQFRLHEGYHYPRSPETVACCRKGNESFREEYGDAVINGGRHLYAIAKEGSRVSGLEYVKFLEKAGLPYRVVADEIDALDWTFEVEESRIHAVKLGSTVMARLDEAGVKVKLNTPATPRLRYEFDRIVVATYGNINPVVSIIPGYECGRLDRFQFEVCEKPVVKMPVEFEDTSVVVLDGEFGCVDPLGTTGHHMLGHVKHAIHHRNIGHVAEVPYHLVPYLDRGIVAKPPYTAFNSFIEAGAWHIPALAEAKHIGSMFTVRAVLPDRDDTDERPTLVEHIEKDKRIIRIFSGKIGTAVEAAKQAVEML